MGDINIKDGAEPPSPSIQLEKEVQDAVIATTNGSSILTNGQKPRAPVTVQKPIPYTFDLGHLICNDTNPLPQNATDEDITSAARDCAQSLLNQLLTTCPIQSTPDGVHLSLPTPTTPLPREKRVPPPKEKTTWEKFAAKKGIQSKRREGNKVYDEATGEWVSKWGFGGRNKKAESSWLVEVDAKKEMATGEAGDVRSEKRAERKERIRRQERRERGNERRAVKSGGG